MNTLFRAAALTAALAGLSGAAGAITVTRDFSASWYDPSHSGHGFNIEVVDNPSGKNMVLYWYTYDASGAPLWVLAQGAVSDVRATLRAVTTSGGRFGNVDPSLVHVQDWGTISVTFTDCNHGTVTWTANDPALQPGSMPIERLTRLYGSACTGGISDDSSASSAGTVVVADTFLANTGVAPQARAYARFESVGGRVDFKVELEDLPVGSYTLRVAGRTRAAIAVAASASGTRGEVEFRSPVEPGKLLLDFDPRGAAIEIAQGTTVFFGSALGTASAAPAPATGNAPPTGNAAYELRVEPQGNNGPDLHAVLDQRADRVEFGIELQDVAAGVYAIRIGGVVRGQLNVTAVPGGTHGELEFRNPVEAGKILLDFDPRGALVEALSNGAVVLSGTMPAQPTGTPSGGGTTGTGSVALSATLVSSGVDSNANGHAEYAQTGSEREFEVQIEDVADGAYALSVGGTIRATIAVSGERGEVKFSDPGRSGRITLDFDPRGMRIEVSRGGVVYLSAVFPG